MSRKILVLACLVIFLAGAAPAFAESPDTLVAQGDAFLNAHDTVNAYQSYLAAWNLDNNHPGANFGLALLNLPHFLIDGGDATLKNWLNTNGIFLTGSLYDFTSTDSDWSKSLVEIQGMISDHVLPHIDQTLGYLAKLDSGFTKELTPQMLDSDDSDNKRWDEGATKAYGAGLNLLKTLLNIACAYNINMSWADFKDNHVIDYYLDNYPAFLTLNTGGQTKMDTALAGFKNCFSDILAGYDYLDGETGSQENDLISIPGGVDDPWFADNKADYRQLMADIRNSLDNEISFDLNQYCPAFEDVAGYEFKFPMRLHLARLFTYPLTRVNLPDYNPGGGIIISSLWDIDPTLNGTLPGMTQAEFVGYGRSFPDEFIHPRLFVVDENQVGFDWNWWPAQNKYYGEVSGYKLYRGPDRYVGMDDSASVLIANLPSTALGYIDTAAPGDCYFYRLYVLHTDGSYYSSQSEPVYRKIYVKKNSSGAQLGTPDHPYRWIRFLTDLSQGLNNVTAYLAGGNYVQDPNTDFNNYNYCAFIGSCNPLTWLPDMDNYPTIIDGDTNDPALGFGYGHYLSVENLIVTNASGDGMWFSGGDNRRIKNCVIHDNHNDLSWNAGLRIESGVNFEINNCTVAGNRRGIAYYGSNLAVKNSIVSNNSEYGILASSSPVFSHNDVWGSGIANYSGVSDPTGTSGNISVDPLFVDYGARDLHLSPGSPCLGTGEAGVNMGAYLVSGSGGGVAGDINGDGFVNITDVILCLRQAVGLDPADPELADLNGDGFVNITDVILVLRKAIGLDPKSK